MYLKKSIILIESQIFNKNFVNNNSDYLKFINVYSDELKEISDIIIENLNFDKYFNNEISYIKKLNLTFNFLIYNEAKYLAYIISFYILKTFLVFNFKYDNNDEKNNTFLESDQIINSIVHSFEIFFIWIELSLNKNVIIKENFNFNKKKTRKNIFNIIIILIEKKKIKTSKIWSNGKSYSLYTLNVKIKKWILLDLYTKKFNYYIGKDNNIYIYIDHHINTFKVLKENSYSGCTFWFDQNSKFFKNILEIKVKIDYEILSFFFEKKLIKFNYKKENLYNYYTQLMDEISKTISNNDRKALSLYSKKLAEISNLLRIYEILKKKEEKYFYFPVIFCFRGRTYYTSSVSFTFYKEFRYCLYEGDYDKEFIQEYHPLNKKIEEIFNPYLNCVEKLKEFNFKNKTNELKYSILWILISVAEIDKNNLTETVHVLDFLEHGINIVNKNIILTKMDEYDELKLYSLKKILKEIDKDIFKKRLIAKDATASCFQHLIKILGAETFESLEWCNMGVADKWSNTYSLILKKFKNDIEYTLSKEELSILNTYFYRESIKKTTMTIQYGASFLTCWKYFLNELNVKNDNDVEKIKKIFKKYYEYANSTIGILKKDSKTLIKILEDLSYRIQIIDESNICEVNLKYNKLEKKQIKITYKGVRYTKSSGELSYQLDKKKIKTSIRANYIHSMDSAVVRNVLSVKPFLTVHDCFLVDYRSTTFLISVINEAMNKTYHDIGIESNVKKEKIFSIFIVI